MPLLQETILVKTKILRFPTPFGEGFVHVYTMYKMRQNKLIILVIVSRVHSKISKGITDLLLPNVSPSFERFKYKVSQ